MNTPRPAVVSEHKVVHARLRSYIIGFLLSVGLTLIAYFSVVNNWFSSTALWITISALALVQLIVQLIFFLHLGRESKPRWNLIMFMGMIVVLSILVVGSMWIMRNLDYNMMESHDAEKHIIEEEGISPR